MRALMLTAAPLYAALLGLLFLVLTARVLQMRRARGILFGSGGDSDFERIIRAHANFVEYAPLGIILLLIAELIGAPHLLLHLLGIALVLGRVLHALGLAGPSHVVWLRSSGLVLTLLSLVGLVITVLLYWLHLVTIAA
ncbi:MAPEG family protein [Rhodoligotrophos ferricapiens]|uniref:MAPEG family protein n=1 Tax=Rhodoligotrophos ferricapiens TaxID=3069264 RepID=UPI00315CAC51